MPSLYSGCEHGTVEVGKRANLLLLSADPLADIGNTRVIAAVIVEGQVSSGRNSM
jgi:imidazolonepropionase-like amidohydrolase